MLLSIPRNDVTVVTDVISNVTYKNYFPQLQINKQQPCDIMFLCSM